LLLCPQHIEAYEQAGHDDENRAPKIKGYFCVSRLVEVATGTPEILDVVENQMGADVLFSHPPFL
jgi:hypothetical protein